MISNHHIEITHEMAKFANNATLHHIEKSLWKFTWRTTMGNCSNMQNTQCIGAQQCKLAVSQPDDFRRHRTEHHGSNEMQRM